MSFAQLPAYFDASHLDVAQLDALCSQTTASDDYPYAANVASNILIYDGAALRDRLQDAAATAGLKAEWCRALKDGPGVFVIKTAYADLSVIDRSTALFRDIVAEEKAAGSGKGDHFGTNERIWNSLQKVCVRDPELFVDYYSNPYLALACAAWLGPHYQITAQMNNVKPGNKAQSAHRDYHLGFQAPETVAQFPAHAQVMSQYLTLQGAIAHVDMPLKMGPTLFLPYSQQLASGYLAYTRPEFRAYFDAHKVQLPLAKGDMVFFSPALFHGAGTNQGTIDRLANLVQISSAFGRTMETIDNAAMVAAVYPVLQARLAAGSIDAQTLSNAIAAVADGYSFPTNLDSDPPVGGNAPETGQQLLHRALADGWSAEAYAAALAAYTARRAA